MPFDRGLVSFSRFKAEAPAPGSIDESFLALLREGVLRTSGIGFTAEVEAGWTAGGHVFDDSFGYAKNARLGGAIGEFALRIDTNRVPPAIKRALKAREEAAEEAADTGLRERGLSNGSGAVGGSKKRRVREALQRAVHDELASGKHRKSAMLPLFFDADRGVLLSGSGSSVAIEQLCAHWRTTMPGSLSPQRAGDIAGVLAGESGARAALADASPSAFSEAPGGVEGSSSRPEVPWAPVDTVDFLGNEFLLWLWWRWDDHGAQAPSLDADGAGSEVQIALSDGVEMACAWGVTGTQSLRASPDGVSPFRLPEARAALAAGKWPRKLGLLLGDGASHWACSLQGDRWLVSAGALPPLPEEVDGDPAAAAEIRAEQVRELDRALLSLYRGFLAVRLGDDWPRTRRAMRGWIDKHKPRRSAPAGPAGQAQPEIITTAAAARAGS